MEKITSAQAYALLVDGVIENENDLKKSANKWILHCIYTAIAAKRIAERLHLDSDYAMALGYVHDIGRKIDHFNHPLEGYKYLMERGYEDLAGICLTHSFIDNDITMTAGGGPDGEKYTKINAFLKDHSPTIYDNIVQMCDLFCLETGFTTVERRLLDITKRKGVFPNSLDHYHKTIELKKRLENEMGCDLYELFPEISKEDLENVITDRQELLKMISGSK